MSHTPGTWVKFTSDARLRKITDKGVLEQRNLTEGLLIGENKEAVLVQQMGNDAYTVVFPDTGHFGWVYTYEFYLMQNKAPEKLALKSMK